MVWIGLLMIAVVVALLALRRQGSTERPSARDQLPGPAVGRREVVQAQLDKVVQLIEHLPVTSAPEPGGATLGREQLGATVRSFMQPAALLGVQTATRMLHVVTSPSRLTVVVKLRPTQPQVAVRTFSRVADEGWTYTSHYAEDMEAAIHSAEAAA